MTTFSQQLVNDQAPLERGRRQIEWASRDMPVLRLIRERFRRFQPLQGIRITVCLHITTETANLVLTLKEGGAEVVMCASNPLSTQDEVAAALQEHYGITVYGRAGEDEATYYRHLHAALDAQPQIIMDDGGDLVSLVHTVRTDVLKGVIGGTEETTTGVVRLRSMQQQGVLQFPMMLINDSQTKHFFDNRYGTGQSAVDAIIRTTNRLFAGRTVVVVGYGWCGKGVALRAHGLGATVVVCEVEPTRALEAVMDGHRVMPMQEAASLGDVFVTVTGDIRVIDREHLARMKDGAMLANAGHFNVEINIPALEDLAQQKQQVRDHVTAYTYEDGRTIYLLAEGRLVNLVAGDGHPASVMDMSFANQALGVEHLVQHAQELAPETYTLPLELDREIARLKLQSMQIRFDALTEEQQRYLHSWEVGTYGALTGPEGH